MRNSQKSSEPAVIGTLEVIGELREVGQPLTAAQRALPLNRREWHGDTPRSRPANLDRLQRTLDRERAELDAQQAELERKSEEANRIQSQLRNLNKDVDDANDRLALADQQLAALTAQLAGLREAFLNGWGDPNIPSGPNYRNIVMIEAATADFPRVRRHLESRVTEAERVLSEFEDQHGLR